MEKNSLKTFRIYVSLKKCVRDGKEIRYPSALYTTPSHEYFNVKFSGASLPNERGFYEVVANIDSLNIQKSKERDNGFKPNDILWVVKPISVTRDTQYEEELKMRDLARLESLFK